ncbi:MAG TPA: alpha/beta hydrolase [Flavobacteriaceae bacterium]|nr:alpha/beta hydrolase [Flavobacteriaceae bacterium]
MINYKMIMTLKLRGALVFLICLFSIGNINSQDKIITLWPNKIPNSISNNEYAEKEVFQDSQLTRTSKVSTPTLSLFLPNKDISNGTAVVICPGGGYSHLALDKEGFKVAKWLNTIGVTAFVLKYRLPSDEIMENKTIGPLQDAQESIRMVRRNAKKWNIDPEKIGIMGFSAGGHLASTLSTHYLDEVYGHDNISAKPDFSILIYPVISMEDNITHQGSKTNLLGEEPSENLIKLYSNEQKVDSLTSPTFLVHATDDKSVLVENSIKYYMALKNNNVLAEMHIYEIGGHGFGLGSNGTNEYWTKDCENWLKLHNF